MRLRLTPGEAFLLAGLLGAVGLAAAHPLYAVDFFWHLKLGEVIAQTHAIPRTDLFSAVHPERPYVQFNWLWELLAFDLVSRFGLRGMRAAQVVLMCASFGLYYGMLRARVGTTAGAFALTALGFVLFEDRFQERPAALVFGFGAALYPFLLAGEHEHERSASRRGLIGLAALCVLWSNLHGGESLLAPLSLGALLAGDAFDRYLRKRASAHPARRFWPFAVSILALLASPTFAPGLWHWSHAIGKQVAEGNEEWQPTYTMLRNGWRPSFVLIALAPSFVAFGYLVERAGAWRREGRARIESAELLLCGGYLVLAHQAVRNAFLCLLPLAFVLRRLAAAGRARRLAPALALSALLFTGIALEDALPYSYGGLARVFQVLPIDLGPDAFPEIVADFASEARLEGGILNDGRFGGYLIWRLWPRCHVFADTRHHFTPEMWPVFEASHDALRRAQAAQASSRVFGTELTVFRGPTFPLGAPPGWRLLYKAGDQELYQDLAGPHARANLERTARWLVKHGVAVPANDPGSEAIPKLATELGARRFLELPMTKLRLHEIEAGLRDSEPVAAGLAWLRRGELDYQLGDYAAAARALERSSALLAGDPRPTYLAALTAFELGDYRLTQALASGLMRSPAALGDRKLRKLQAVAHEAQTRVRNSRFE